MPEKFNAALPNADEILTLNLDFAALKGAKPANVSIMGTEMKMPHWNHMLREIVRQLYALDSDSFLRATQMENVRKSLFTAEPTDFKIAEGFFMKTHFDTETCLKTAKALVENFDRLGDTDIKNEIWFTLRQG